MYAGQQQKSVHCVMRSIISNLMFFFITEYENIFRVMYYSPSNIIKIREDEGSPDVKTTSNDVLSILPS